MLASVDPLAPKGKLARRVLPANAAKRVSKARPVMLGPWGRRVRPENAARPVNVVLWGHRARLVRRASVARQAGEALRVRTNIGPDLL